MQFLFIILKLFESITQEVYISMHQKLQVYSERTISTHGPIDQIHRITDIEKVFERKETISQYYLHGVAQEFNKVWRSDLY